MPQDFKLGVYSVIVFLVGLFIGYTLCHISWNNWCVERGWAEYNIKTGEVLYAPPRVPMQGIMFNMDQHK